MVTIEQKLALFSKLLNQEIKSEMDEKFRALDQEYERKIAESKFKTDKEAQAIIDTARKNAELKRMEQMSRGKISNKKERVQVKEEMVTRFMTKLNECIVAFTKQPEYQSYLKQLIEELVELKGCKDPLKILVTQWDYTHYQKMITDALTQLGITSFQFEVTKEPILGGIIVMNLADNTKIDSSIKEVIDEQYDQIVAKISSCLEEVK